MTLFETQAVINELDVIHSELSSSGREIMLEELKRKKRKLILIYFLLFVLLFLIATLLAAWWNAKFMYDEITISIMIENIFSGIGPGFAAVILGYFIHFICYDKKSTKTIDEGRQFTKREQAIFDRRFGERAGVLLNRRKELRIRLKSSEVPPVYHNSYALDWMVEALINKRADNMKEAINLFENYVMAERHQAELVEAIKSITVIENIYC